MIDTGAHTNGGHNHVESNAGPDIFAATSLADIHAGLAQLHQQEASVTQRLNDLIASQKDLSRELGRLDGEPHIERREAPGPGADQRQGHIGRG